MQIVSDSKPTGGTAYVENTAVFGVGPTVLMALALGPVSLGIFGAGLAVAACAEIHDRKYNPTK